MKDLSILIPSRQEIFLKNTIDDILKNIEADTEIIITLDGAWAEPPIPQYERVNIIFVPQSIGQRAATNIACKIAQGKYVMKVDAHCSFDQGFDRKMIEAFKETDDNVTMVPMMRNLWAFDWKCHHCGWKKYQGPTPTKCEHCGETTYIKRKMIWSITAKDNDTAFKQWKGHHSPKSVSYCFDTEPHFQYFEDYKHRPEYIKDKGEKGITETMSLQGSCFMLTREKYWELNICDETVGSWGNQGIETACKTWLSGGRVLVNHKTWYAHLFRTQGGDFSFPYNQSDSEVSQTKQKIKNLFFENKWPKQVHSLSWLIERFSPVPGWGTEELARIKEFDLKDNEK